MFRFFLVTGIGLAIINSWISWWLWRALSGSGWLRCVLCGLVLVLGAAFPTLQQYDITVRVQAPAPDSPARKTLKFGVITDMHLGRLLTAGRLARAVELLAPQQPDAIFYVGDIIDDHIKLDAEATAAALALAQPPLGHWAVPGNHEYISGSIDKSMDFLRRVGMQVLRDQWAVVDNSFVLAGRDDLGKPGFTGVQRASLADILADLPEQYRQLPLVVLDHQPAALDEAREAGAALELSGHTHYGQLWPFNFVVERRYLNPLGLLTLGSFHSIVSAGTGTWGPPLRNTGRAQVLLVTVHFAPEANTP